MAIRELLKEELANSVRMERDYQRELARLPRGCVVKKLIRGKAYYYLAFREEGKVRFQYQGRDMDVKKIALHRKAKQDRIQYRKLLSEVRKQIKFMRKALRAKQAV
ncbi:MAG TPA: hypothetical protein DCZ95_11940 [Verrucomicrobia bacterium]|nr:MAG: hypothetical protein A2X46_13985 [Lentisphaerae bacterium GWF2_57_35]HBA84796.1 hypothetical protein [Verrucomicrobiota bacterium]